MRSAFGATAGIVAAASPAAASRDAGGEYGVWVFLAFCAFIVIGQLIPLVGSLRKTVKEVEENAEKEKAEETVRG